jgi:branched-chain amino acid transport system permease protein
MVTLLTEFATWLGPQLLDSVPGLPSGAAAAMKPLIFGLSLMLFLVFEPRGLAHRWQLMKAAWRLRPFSY